ncbi:MAG: hypothetical protein KGI38_12290 [Thaumarchaeota archaeon]|nr:hypothetical protein [Nitrososphaerota archaeon]
MTKPVLTKDEAIERFHRTYRIEAVAIKAGMDEHSWFYPADEIDSIFEALESAAPPATDTAAVLARLRAKVEALRDGEITESYTKLAYEIVLALIDAESQEGTKT